MHTDRTIEPTAGCTRPVEVRDSFTVASYRPDSEWPRSGRLHGRICDQVDSGENLLPPGMGVAGTGWLCGLRLDPRNEYPDLYVVCLQDRNAGWPVLQDGRIVFFTRIDLAQYALSLDDDPSIRSARLPPATIDETYVFDMEDILSALVQDAPAPPALIVEFLNLLLDLVDASGVPIPPSYKRALYMFANHMTFDGDLSKFFKNERVSCSTIVNAVYWAIGAVASRSIVLR